MLLYEKMFVHRGLITIEEFEQAKAMHKEEHAETFSQGMQWIQYQRDLVNGGSEYWDEEPKQFEEYYNETFNK